MIVVEEVPASCDGALLPALTDGAHSVGGAAADTVGIGHLWTNKSVKFPEVDVSAGGPICPSKVCFKYINDQTLTTADGLSVVFTDWDVRCLIVSCGGK